MSVPDSFSAVYVVDLSPSLCDVARERFARLGWKNVHVVCEDARTFRLDPSSDVESIETQAGDKHGIKADFVSMSYSLSMIPECVVSYHHRRCERSTRIYAAFTPSSTHSQICWHRWV